MRKRIYVSGPITLGDLSHNIDQACRVGRHLISLGFSVLIPQLTAYIDGCPPSITGGIAHETWLDNDLSWVDVADAVFRLPGDSKGADIEVAYAYAHNIPVFYSTKMLELHFKNIDSEPKHTAGPRQWTMETSEAAA